MHIMQIYGRFHPCYFRNDGVINVRIEDLIDELKVAPIPTLFSGKFNPFVVSWSFLVLILRFLVLSWSFIVVSLSFLVVS